MSKANVVYQHTKKYVAIEIDNDLLVNIKYFATVTTAINKASLSFSVKIPLDADILFCSSSIHSSQIFALKIKIFGTQQIQL